MPDPIPPASIVGTPHHFYNLRLDRHHWLISRHEVMHDFLANCELWWSVFLRVSNISFYLSQVFLALPPVIDVMPMTIFPGEGVVPP